MKRAIFSVTVITAILVVFFMACTGGQTQKTDTGVVSTDSLVKRGGYLVNTMGCDDCHSPKKFGPQGRELDMEHRFAGHLSTTPIGKIDATVMKNGWILFNMDLTAAVGPWGISYAANISSDETGIGNWTEEQFFKAIRYGKSKGLDESRPLLPPMPWQNFSKMTDLDIKAMFAYLKSTKPVQNVVPGFKPWSELQ